MPKFAAFAMLFAMANCGLPGTRGFVGEFMVILAAVKVNFWLGLPRPPRSDPGRGLHAVDVQARVLRRGRQRPHVAALKDIYRREFLMLATVAAAILAARHLPEAVYRRDARLGRRPALPRRAVSKLLMPGDDDDSTSFQRSLQPCPRWCSPAPLVPFWSNDLFLAGLATPDQLLAGAARAARSVPG